MDVFVLGEVKWVYLNFFDFWLKKCYEKCCLMYFYFFKKYEEVMGKDGVIYFKMDNCGLFEYFLKSFFEYGLLLIYVSFDLYNSNLEGNIMIEYEEKFLVFG